MRKIFGLSFLLFMVFGVMNKTFAQDTNVDAHDIVISIPEVALLDIEPSASTTINLGATAPTEAGAPLVFSATNTDLWLNYSSIVGSTTEPSRKVTVKISSGTLPGGTVLKVQAAADAGNGAGTVGTPTGEITLTATDQDFITGVGSCYTGTPENNGHQLTYSLELDASGNYSDLDFDDSSTVTITYTLSDN